MGFALGLFASDCFGFCFVLYFIFFGDIGINISSKQQLLHRSAY